VQCYHAAEEAMATTTRRAATEEDLLAMPQDGHKYELSLGRRLSALTNRPSARRLCHLARAARRAERGV